MTSKLCLHGVHIAHPESFAADVARLLQGRVIRGRLREKEYKKTLKLLEKEKQDRSDSVLFCFPVFLCSSIISDNPSIRHNAPRRCQGPFPLSPDK